MALESGNEMEFSVYLGAIDMYVCMYSTVRLHNYNKLFASVNCFETSLDSNGSRLSTGANTICVQSVPLLSSTFLLQYC
jgi:hypothetical protein